MAQDRLRKSGPFRHLPASRCNLPGGSVLAAIVAHFLTAINTKPGMNIKKRRGKEDDKVEETERLRETLNHKGAASAPAEKEDSEDAPSSAPHFSMDELCRRAILLIQELEDAAAVRIGRVSPTAIRRVTRKFRDLFKSFGAAQSDGAS